VRAFRLPQPACASDSSVSLRVGSSGAQLSVADAAGEKVILICHLPLQDLFNGQAVRERIASYPGLVVIVLTLTMSGFGTYTTDAGGTHHLAPNAVSGLEVNEDAFGILEVFDDKLRLEMKGTNPDGSPNGWPIELALPRGGRLVTAEAAAPLMAGFIWFWLFLARTVFAPLSPVVRMLTSQDSSGAADGTTQSGATKEDAEDAEDASGLV